MDIVSIIMSMSDTSTQLLLNLIQILYIEDDLVLSVQNAQEKVENTKRRRVMLTYTAKLLSCNITPKQSL